MSLFFFFQAEDGIRDRNVTGVQTCALPICQPQVALRREGALQVADAAFVGPLPLPASDPPGPAGFPEQAPGHGRDHSRLLSLGNRFPFCGDRSCWWGLASSVEINTLLVGPHGGPPGGQPLLGG